METLVRKHFEERFKKGEYTWRELETLPIKQIEGKLLEVGCGSSLSYFPRELDVHGVDIVPPMIRLFKIKYPNANVVIADVKKLPFRDKTFEVIVSRCLLHHLVGNTLGKCEEYVNIALQEVKRLLTDKGYLLLREHLAKTSMFSFVMFHVTLLCAKLHINLGFLDIHSEVVTFFLTEKKIRRLFEKMGFTPVELSWKRWRLIMIDLGKYDAEFLLRKAGAIYF